MGLWHCSPSGFRVDGVVMDFVGAAILSRAHNAESTMKIREGTTASGARSGMMIWPLAEKRAGFFILAFGLSLCLTSLILKNLEGVVSMGIVAGAVLWGRIVSRKVRDQARKAKRENDGGDFPEQ